MALTEDSSSLHFFQNCTHEYVINGVCSNCSLQVTGSSSGFLDDHMGYSSFHQHHSGVDPHAPIDAEIRNLPVSESIKLKAMENARNANSRVQKLGKRNVRIFILTYISAVQLQEQFDPESLINHLGVTKAEVNTAIRFTSGIESRPFFPKRNGITIPVVVISPLEHIDGYCNDLKLNQYKEIILEIGKKAIDADPALLEEKPKNIAIAIVKYFLDSHGFKYTGFSGMVKRSPPVIKEYTMKVSKAVAKASQENPTEIVI